MGVPPAGGPEFGLTDAIVGDDVGTYENPFASVATPPDVAIATAWAPAVPAGVTAETVVALTTFTDVAAAPPTVSDVVPERFVPVTVIAVPPDTGPVAGLTVAIVGGAK